MKTFLLNSISGIEQDFGTFNEPKAAFVNEKWLRRVKKKQVHGTKVVAVTGENHELFDADGLFTSKKNLLLPLVNADCYPLLFARKDGNSIAALHVGWRGALEGIIYNFSIVLKEQDENIDDWVVSIGPGAKPCCYQVSEEIINAFCTKYNFNVNEICPRFRMIDLSVIITYQLKSIGINTLEEIKLCTLCSIDDQSSKPCIPKFHSYRRDANKDVQVSAIMMI